MKNYPIKCPKYREVINNFDNRKTHFKIALFKNLFSEPVFI